MATYSIADVLSRWAKGTLTLEQAVGHILQNLQMLFQRQDELERRLRQLESPPTDPHVQP